MDKSSHSHTNSGYAEVAGRKSSYSVNGGACVEVAIQHEVLIRDTQDRDNPDRITVSIPFVSWGRFLDSLR
jgi:hypothetical protein